METKTKEKQTRNGGQQVKTKDKPTSSGKPGVGARGKTTKSKSNADCYVTR